MPICTLFSPNTGNIGPFRANIAVIPAYTADIGYNTQKQGIYRYNGNSIGINIIAPFLQVFGEFRRIT